MTLQKGTLNGVSIIEDSSAVGTPVTNVSEDGGDIVAQNAAVIASRRSAHVVDTVAGLASLASPYLVDNQTYVTLGYTTVQDGGGNLYQYDSGSSATVDGGFVINGPGGTGRFLAVDTSIANVKQFGATGDGVTDDTAAIQAAVDTLLPVYIPNGTFITSQLTGTNVKIFGEGTIKKLASTKGILISLVGENEIKDITVDYNWVNADQSTSYSSNTSIYQAASGILTCNNVKLVNSFTKAIRTDGASLDINNCSFISGAPHNDLTGGSERPTVYLEAIATATQPSNTFLQITNNVFIGPNSTGDFFLNPGGINISTLSLDGDTYKRAIIKGNTFQYVGQNAQGNLSAGIDTYNGARNVIATNNNFEDCGYAAGKFQNSSNIIFSNNTVKNMRVEAGASSQIAYGVLATEKNRSSTLEQNNIIIKDNIFTSGMQYVGIYNTCDNAIIINNIVTDVTLATLGEGIYNTANNVQIEGNILNEIGRYGIRSNGNACKINNNYITHPSGNNDHAITFSGDSVQLIGNELVSDSSSTASVIRTSGPASNIHIDKNNLINGNIGLDIRASSGPTNGVTIGINSASGITSPIIVNAACNNIRYDTGTQLATTTELEASASGVNTTGKHVSRKAFNTTTNRLVSAVGSSAGSVWVDDAGTTIHTPS